MKPESFFFPEFGNIAVLLCTAAVTLYLPYYVIVHSKRPKLPPGPRGIPLLGNLVQMIKGPHLKLSEWAKRYGKMYTIHMANRATLVVNDVMWMKELFGTMASTGKFKTDTCLQLSQGPYGILNTEGSAWEEQRQFCIRSLREQGYGKSGAMEILNLQEVHEVCEWIIRSNEANPQASLDMTHVLYQSTINALWVLVTGERLKLDDSASATLFNNYIEAVQYAVKSGLGFFPWLKYIAPKLSGFVDIDRACKDLHRFVGDKFEEHKETYVEGQTRDLMDAYIEHMNKTLANNNWESRFYGKIGYQNSLSSVVEIFVAGAETTSATVKWLLIYLCFHAEDQKKMQNEIDEIVGREKDPSLTDRLMMPYTEAVILETLRLSSLVMLGVPHELLDDVTFKGYNLPKGMILLPNMYHIHHDPEIWDDPEKFRPERFLTEEGAKLKEYLVPFQAGKRQCLGEPLARDILFLFATTLFQQFSFRSDSGISKGEYLTPDVGICLLPRCSKFVVSTR